MGRKRQLKTEVCVYFFDLESEEMKLRIVNALDEALRKSRCGKMVGAGTSICNFGTYTVELMVNDSEGCTDIVAQCCASLGLDDYEMGVFDE